MRLINVIIPLLLFWNIINAQPQIDNSFRKTLIEQKSKHYQQLIFPDHQKTLNQNDYDINYYSLNLTPDPITQELNGIADIVGKVISSSLNNVELNFWDGMTITDIHNSDLPGIQLNYSRNNDLLNINLDREYSEGEIFKITVSYNGKPNESNFQSFNFDSHNSQPMIWTMNSSSRARGWFPCKDVPSDKADSMDIRVTVPSNLIVASNGKLMETQTQGNLTTYWWHEKYPIATYLVSLAIYPYEMHYDNYIYGSRDTMQIQFYSFPGNFDQNRRINDLVKNMLEVFSNMFGEYPFVDEKYGQADFLWGGGMEHQTCTSYGSWNEALFAHEIAHQWWGDMITCDSFHHIWLNEGFASYSEALWFEAAYPPYTASEYQMDYQLYLGDGTVFVENPDYENIFDSGLSYVKGSWILHMLRHVVGDNAFFNILKEYYKSPEHKYGNATTEGFKNVSEQVSGMELDKFFHQWIYEENFPRYSYKWSWANNGSSYDINLEIEQKQTNYYFWMPIDITITTAQGEQTFIVWDSLQTQSFQLSLASEPIHLELDKNDWILKIINEEMVNPQFDEGILLVNGVSFDLYGTEIWNAYQNSAFWGYFPITFWDCFNPTSGGYPSSLPEPIGHGKISAETLGRYSTVIWVGNNYSGDLGRWQQAAIIPYLEAGGNLILLSRKGQNYFSNELENKIGITWTENELNTLQNCEAVYPGLQNMTIIGEQTSNAVFQTQMQNAESKLLFSETSSFDSPKGIGVWYKPESGGTIRNEGGNFVFISGRPYRYNSSQLKSNMEFILNDFFHEGNMESPFPILFELSQNYPNPFNGTTAIEYVLYLDAKVKITIYNMLGEKIKTLINEDQSRGSKTATWDGTDSENNIVASGVYIYGVELTSNIEAGKYKKLVYLK